MTSHTCHWPGCTVEISPELWGCKPHWFALPRGLRNKLNSVYVPGQEITKTPSADYIQVAKEIRSWIVEHHT